MTDRLTPEQRRRCMQANRSNGTQPERMLARELWRRGLRYRKNMRSVPGSPDICFKGRKVAVIGELQARTYEAKDGTTRMSLDVSADEVEFLTPKGDDQGSSYSAPTAPRPQQNRNQDVAGFTDISSDEIPF